MYNGSKTRDWVSQEEAASPTMAMESILLTSVIDAKEQQDVMTANICQETSNRKLLHDYI